jgi:DNA polymerase I-like protein with 3'-5' exonuclease and polymerase domains
MRLVFDFETTGAQRNKGHPFDYRNKACVVGFRNIDSGEKYVFKLEYDDTPYGEAVSEIQNLLDRTSLLIGFNTKFDLHWLARYGHHLGKTTKVFDCSVAWFILDGQRTRYPSLNLVASHYGVEQKLDIVKTEYWDRGLDTDQVPYDILVEYLEQDLVVTELVYKKIEQQLKESSYEMNKLVGVTMYDLVTLQDIEWNGLLYNKKKSLKKGDDIQEEIQQIDNTLKNIFGADWLNINSGDHLSAVLYGGTINIPYKEDYIFVYKDGRETTKTRNTTKPVSFRGLFKPLEGTELAKDGFYRTDVGTLTTLNEKARGEAAQVLELLLYRSKIEKQRGTYYHGFPKKIEELNWEDDIIHSNFNQVVAVSGRLSSDKPNVQNLEGGVKECIISRFSIRRNKND